MPLDVDIEESKAGVAGMGALAGIAAAVIGIVGGLVRGFAGWPVKALIGGAALWVVSMIGMWALKGRIQRELNE